MMKRIVSLFLMALALLAGGELFAAEASQPVNVKDSVRKAATHLKQLSREQREAAFAEVFGLLFMPDGKTAYSSKTSYQKIEEKGKSGTIRDSVPYRRVNQGALYVGTDGKLYDFYAALPARTGKTKKKEAWNLSKLYIHYAGKAAVKERFAEELAEMEVQRAICFLRRMSPELRQSLFAEMLNLLYTEDETDAYTGETREESIAGEKVPYRRVKRSAMYLDAEGKACSYYSVKDVEKAKAPAWYAWWGGVKLAIHHVGQERIFAPFMDEIRAMKKYAAAR